MARIYSIITFILIALTTISTSFDLNCRFEYTNGYAVIGRVYICISSGINMPTPESARFNRMIGTHQGQQSNGLVDGFHANRQIISYFPQGLDWFFPNLISLSVMRCGMKEIHQSDLKPFPGLRSLNMYDNKLQVLEQGLMDYNPNLEVVGFHGNRLVHIDPNVFDNLNKMTDLYVEGVPCIDKNTDTRDETLACVNIMKTQCVDPEFVDMNKQVKNLINESEILSPEEFIEKADMMENVVADYEFSNFRPLSDSIKNLRSLKMDIPTSEPIENVPEDPMHLDSPDSATQATISSTEAPISSSEASTSTTEASTSTTEATTSTTEATTTTTEATTTTSEAITSTTEATTSTTESAISTTEAATSTTESPLSSTEATTSASPETTSTTEVPLVTTEATTSTTEATTLSTEAATSTTETTTTTETPISSTKAPKSSPESPDDPKNDQEPLIDKKFEKLTDEINDLVTDTLANVNNLKMIQDATDESIKELKAAQDATKSYVESIEEKVKAIETQVQERFSDLDKKLDSILRALRIGE
ncbi:unnamed protein product [Chironomus riparius]|uniref:Uncharacterized protein n=1 Tax=Chironomus riparius TaxID=315576 RepID=A0A9P0NL10_9DIPT|nr:unnamed protein product [Chironomus riparius]